MLKSRKLLCSFVFVFIAACVPSSPSHEVLSPSKEAEMTKSKQIWQEVTVKHINLEGGFYGLISKKGSKLLPVNLPAQYKNDGTILKVKGHLVTDMMTTQQWGEPFKILEVELIKVSTKKQPDPNI